MRARSSDESETGVGPRGRRCVCSPHSRIAILNLALCTAPYLGLRAYLSLGMHDAAVAVAVPAPWLLGTLFALGVLVPTVGVLWTIRWVIRDRLHFRLSGLLTAYGVLILLFASSYAIVQARGVGTSFSGMAPLWDVPATLDVHVARLHDVFFESLYLSVMTITTVGYGDLTPLTQFGKILTAAEGLAGIGFVGVALGQYFSVCLRRQRGCE